MIASVPRLRFRLLVPLMGILVGAGLLAACTTDASGPPRGPSGEADTTSSESRPAAVKAAPGAGAAALRQQLRDATVEARVTKALAGQRQLRVFDFGVQSDSGRVTLRGDVNTREQHRLAERVVRSADGVTAVANAITVNGRPASDASADDAQGRDASTVYHTVQSGESLWTIAREYQASVQQLKAMNDLAGGGLQPGDRIRVR